MLFNFTNRYQLSKTLRFELKPIGKTKDYIEQNALIDKDEERAGKYKKVKEIIDRYHKDFIADAIQGLILDGLAQYEELFFKVRDDKEDAMFKSLQKGMRKQISEAFMKREKYPLKDRKVFIKEKLYELELTDEEKLYVKDFEDFTTYFSGFHENRENIYTDKAQHTAIAYRMIDENLPTFLKNKRDFELRIRAYPGITEQAANSFDRHIEGATLEMIFELDFFNHLGKQKYIDIYNQWLGELNKHTNLYRQAYGCNKKELPNLKPLYKQILSDRESHFLEVFENDEQIVEVVKDFYESKILNFECCGGRVNLLEKLQEIFVATDDYDTSKMFIKNDRSMTDISQAVFGNYQTIQESLWAKHLADNPKLEKSKKLAESEEKFYKQKIFSIYQIEKALEYTNNSYSILPYFANFNAFNDEKKPRKSLIELIEAAYKQWNENPTQTEAIKNLLDAILNLQRFLKPLSVTTDEEKDNAFYAYFDNYFEAISKIVKIYDKVRNFKTKKPYSLEKFKLNFENKGDFLGGWVDSHTENSDNGTQAGGYLFRKKNIIGEYDYYVGVSKDSKLFRSHLQNGIHADDKSEFERLDYYQLKSASVYGNSYVGGSYDEDKKMLFQSIYKFSENINLLKADFDRYIYLLKKAIINQRLTA